MNITNPKVAILFVALLPQFADPAFGSLVMQIMTLGALFLLATFIVFGGVTLFAGLLGKFLRKSEWAQYAMNWVAGVIFIGLAARLVGVTRF